MAKHGAGSLRDNNTVSRQDIGWAVATLCRRPRAQDTLLHLSCRPLHFKTRNYTREFGDSNTPHGVDSVEREGEWDRVGVGGRGKGFIGR